MDTLGSLCDKLTVVRLKHWFAEEPQEVLKFDKQTSELISEINQLSGADIGDLFCQLADINRELWMAIDESDDVEFLSCGERGALLTTLRTLNKARNKLKNEIDDAYDKCHSF